MIPLTGVAAIIALVGLATLGRLSGRVRSWNGMGYNYRSKIQTPKTRWKRARRCRG